MFNCGNCGKTTKAGQGQTKVVTKTQDKKYTYTNEYGDIMPMPLSKHVRNRTPMSFKEIVQEVAVGPCCASKVNTAA